MAVAQGKFIRLIKLKFLTKKIIGTQDFNF